MLPFKELEDIPVKTRYCGKCKQWLPVTSFDKGGGGGGNGVGYLRHECKDCRKKLVKRVAFLKKLHKSPDYGYVCPICLRNEEQLKTFGFITRYKKFSWALDHNHETREFRGFLCPTCNMNIGQLGDSIETLQRAIEYLKSDQNKPKN